MAANERFKHAFIKGENCWKNNDYFHARHWFEIAVQHPLYRDKSLSKLIQIDIREGKYARARQTLKANEQLNSILLKQIYGLLENIENNFESSRRYYSECMLEPNMQYKSLLAIAKLYIQTGDNDVARKMLETLQLNDKFNIQSTFELVSIATLEGDYKNAYALLMTIDERLLTPKLLQHYRILDSYLLSMLGKFNRAYSNPDPFTDYMTHRLIDRSEDFLIKHLNKHMDQRKKATDGCFFRYTDLKKLLVDARDKIETMNANHFEISDMYRFRLDSPIGFKGEEITSDLCVVTMLGTKDIITMYPVQLSEEFDREGFSTSQEIAIKRKQRRINE